MHEQIRLFVICEISSTIMIVSMFAICLLLHLQEHN